MTTQPCALCGVAVANDANVCGLCQLAIGTADLSRVDAAAAALYAAVRPAMPWLLAKDVCATIARQTGVQPAWQAAPADVQPQPFAWMADDIESLRGLVATAIREQAAKRHADFRAVEQRQHTDHLAAVAKWGV